MCMRRLTGTRCPSSRTRAGLGSGRCYWHLSFHFLCSLYCWTYSWSCVSPTRPGCRRPTRSPSRAWSRAACSTCWNWSATFRSYGGGCLRTCGPSGTSHLSSPRLPASSLSLESHSQFSMLRPACFVRAPGRKSFLGSSHPSAPQKQQTRVLCFHWHHWYLPLKVLNRPLCFDLMSS